MTQAERQYKMATRKSREFKTDPMSRERKSKAAVDDAFPNEQGRFPLHIPGAYQVAMGTRAEIVAWLRRVPRNTRAILIHFSSEASYKEYGPIFWHVAHELPECVARIQSNSTE